MARSRVFKYAQGQHALALPSARGGAAWRHAVKQHAEQHADQPAPSWASHLDILHRAVVPLKPVPYGATLRLVPQVADVDGFAVAAGQGLAGGPTVVAIVAVRHDNQ